MQKIVLIIAILLAACNSQPKEGEALIVCTTNILADAAQTLIGEKIKVRSLMGPGVDPHLYKASQGDLQLLRQADLIIYNGLYLEGKMSDILGKMAKTANVLSVGDQLDTSLLIATTEFGANYDPHIWFDLSIWLQALEIIKKQLISHFPEHQESITKNYKNYSAALVEKHEWIKTEIAQIPLENRVLVTAHDAFSYFGKAYDIEVKALQGISTLAEYGLRDVSELVNMITERKIPAIFVESSVNERSITSVVEGCRKKGHPVVIGGMLFTDALDLPDKEAGNYLGMIKHNVSTIKSALNNE